MGTLGTPFSRLNKEVSETLNSYFGKIVTTLNSKDNGYIAEKVPIDLEPVKRASYYEIQKSFECRFHSRKLKLMI